MPVIYLTYHASQYHVNPNIVSNVSSIITIKSLLFSIIHYKDHSTSLNIIHYHWASITIIYIIQRH